MADPESNTETWRPITGLEEQYEVSDHGRVRSLLDSHRNPRREPLVMRARYDRWGYCRICLCINGKPKHRLVHRLMADAFLPDDPSREFINHIDGDKANNVLSNIERVTRLENAAHAVATGLYPSGDRHGSRTGIASRPRGDNHWMHRHPERIKRGAEHFFAMHPERHARGEKVGAAKLTEAQVREIRDRYAAGGTSHPRLGREYGVAHSVIGRIVRREIWRHVV